MQASSNAVSLTGRLTDVETGRHICRQAGRQAGIKTDRQKNRQAGVQVVRQTDTQTRVPINLGLVDGND